MRKKSRRRSNGWNRSKGWDIVKIMYWAAVGVIIFGLLALILMQLMKHKAP